MDRSSTADGRARRDLAAWEQRLFAGVRPVGPDESLPYIGPREYDGPVRPGAVPYLVRYHGSILQPELLSAPAATAE